MLWLVTIIHVLICLVLVLVVLLQAGKGAEVGAVFGGSNQTIFGSRGAATFLSKVTAVCAIGFMITSLTLVIMNSRQSSKSIMDQNASEATTAPSATAPAATGNNTPTPTTPQNAGDLGGKSATQQPASPH